jgi:hypothetical protein
MSTSCQAFRVHSDCHLIHEKNYYTVPHQYAQQLDSLCNLHSINIHMLREWTEIAEDFKWRPSFYRGRTTRIPKNLSG